MPTTIIGTETGVWVPEVGELFWEQTGARIIGEFAPRYADTSPDEWSTSNNLLVESGQLEVIPTYATPSDSGFALRLVLNDSFSLVKTGIGSLVRDRDFVIDTQATTSGYLNDVDVNYPDWMIKFLTDIQDGARLSSFRRSSIAFCTSTGRCPARITNLYFGSSEFAASCRRLYTSDRT